MGMSGFLTHMVVSGLLMQINATGSEEWKSKMLRITGRLYQKQHRRTSNANGNEWISDTDMNERTFGTDKNCSLLMQMGGLTKLMEISCFLMQMGLVNFLCKWE